MSIATLLIKDTNNTITIVARDLPGDPPSQGWASPWACAAWVALGSYCSAREQQMQLDALEYWKRLAVDEPEGGVRIAEMVDVAGVCESGDSVSSEFMKRVPGFRVLEGLGEGLVGAGYESVVVDPGVFLPWLRKKLEADGVRFQRIGTVTSLGEINGMGLGHDVLINASGAASLTLEDVRDEGVVVDRTYTVVVKLEYDGMFVRREKGQYTYMFGRGDGTAVVGGLSEPVDMPARKREEVHQDVSAHLVFTTCVRKMTANLRMVASRPGTLQFARDFPVV